MTVELGEIQGLAKSAYGRWPNSWYRLLRIDDPTRAAAWLAEERMRVTFVEVGAAVRKDAPHRRNLAFTCAGMARLGLPVEAMRGFDAPFREGMTSEPRARLLGDVRADGGVDPWVWGREPATTPHVLQMLYAGSADAAQALLQTARAESEGALSEVTPPICATLHANNAEHFRFRDGVSQPTYEGFDKNGRTALGELLLGYKDGKDNRAEGPKVDPRLPGAELLPPDDVGDGDGDFGRNGSYLVCRQMSQDVAGFYGMIDRLAAREDVARWSGRQEPEARRAWVASRIVGRWPNGTPVARSADREDPVYDDPGFEEVDFDFADDQRGERCPFGSHVRRTNPRDSVFEPWRTVTDAERAARRADSERRRLLRRGRAYGPAFEAEPDAARGLMFIALCSDLERQFEFVQKSWLLNPSFAGLEGETDPLVGVEDTTLTLQADPFAKRLTGVASHARTIGGAYFFLPSRSALAYLSSPKA